MIALLKWISLLCLLLAMSSLSLTATTIILGRPLFLSQQRRLVSTSIKKLRHKMFPRKMAKKKSEVTKEVSTFAVGSVVVLKDSRGAYPNSPQHPRFGSMEECEGVITHMGNDDDPLMVIVAVAWSNKFESEYRIRDLELMDVMLNLPSVSHRFEHTPALLEVGAIVYLRNTGSAEASREWPTLGSDYETDLKVINVMVSKFRSICRYNLFNPVSQQYFKANCEEIVTAEDRMKYKATLHYTSNVTIPGIVVEGDRFYQLGEYLYNQTESVILKMSPVIAGMFTKIK